MALSFFMHQRSNTEVMGNLQSSVSSMQELQAAQERIIELQDHLAAAEDKLDAAEDLHETVTTAQQDAIDTLQDKLDAMTNLYLLEQAYAAKDFDACRQIIEDMENREQTALLVIDGAAEGAPSAGVTLPAEWEPPLARFEEIKAAVEKAE